MGNKSSSLGFPLGERLPTEQDQWRRRYKRAPGLGTASWLSRGVLWFDFSSEPVFWNCRLCIFIDILSVPCQCFLAGISKGSFGVSGVTPRSTPAVPGKKEDSPEKALDPAVPTQNHPLEKSCFPRGLSGDVRDTYLISSLQWPFSEFPLCVSTGLSWFCKLNGDMG